MAVANIARFTVGVGLGGITALLRGTRLATSGISALAGVMGTLLGIVSKLTAAFALLNGAFAAIILVNAQMIDRIGKLNKVIGVSTDTIQKFAFAGEQTGVSFDQSTIALRRFARRLGEAQRNTGELLPALRRLGIDVRDNDGRLKSAEQVLFEFADGLKNTKSETAKLALAFKAFDSEGAELVATLEQGSGALKELFDEAERLGFVLDEDVIKSTEAFNDSFNVLVNIVKGAIRTFVGSLAPALNRINEDLADLVVKVTDGTGSFRQFGEYLKNTFFDYVIDVVEAIEILYLGFVKLYNFIASQVNKLDFLSDDQLTQVKNAVEEIEELGNVVSGLDVDRYKFGLLVGNMQEIAEVLQEMGIQDERLQQIMDIGAVDAFFASYGFGADKILEARDALLAIAKPLIAAENMGMGLIPEPGDSPFQRLKDYLLELKGISAGMVEDLKETATDMEEVVVTGQNRIGETLLGKIFGVERVQEFWDDWYSTGAGTLNKFGAVAKLILGEQIFENLREGLEAAGVGDFVKTMSDGLVKAATMFEDALANAVANGKLEFDDLAKHLRQVLAKALVQKFFTGPIMSIFGLASGGPAKAGQPYIVGEEGPELFVPKQSGTVVPNHALGNMSGGPGLGMGQQVTYNINAVDARSFKQLVAADPEFIFGVTQAGARRLPA